MYLKLNGFKSVDRDLLLTHRNLLIGPNGAGKSAVLDGIRFLALGYVPALGRTPADTAALMRGDRIDVSLTYSTGKDTVISRSLIQTDKGFRREASASFLEGANVTDSEEAIRKIFGATVAEVEEVLDVRTLLSATPQERARRVCSLLQAGAASASERIATIARDTVTRLVELPPERIPADYLKAMPLVPKAAQEILRQIARELEARISSGVEGALAWANAEKKSAAIDLEHKTGARIEIEKEINRLPPVTESMGELESERSRLERKIGADKEKVRASRQHLDSRTDALADLVKREAEMKNARARLERIGSVAQHTVWRDQAEYELNTASAADKLKPISIDKERRDLESAEAIVAADKASPLGQVLRLAKPLTGKAAPAWVRKIGREINAVILKHHEPLPDPKSIEKYRKALKAAQAAMQKRAGEIADGLKARERYYRLRDKCLDYEKAAALVEHCESAYAHAQKRLQEVPAVEPVVMTSITMDETRLATVMSSIKTIMDGAALRNEFKRIVQSIREAEARRNVFAGLEWALQRERERALDSHKSILVKRMEEFLHVSYTGFVPYFHFENGREDMGWMRPDECMIPLKSLSGGEWLVYTAALTSSILHIRKPELRVLLVEAGESDFKNLYRLCCGINEVAPSYDCAIVCCQRPLDHVEGVPWLNGWTVHKMGEE